MKIGVKIKKVLFLMCTAVCIIGGIAFLWISIQYSIKKGKLYSNSVITTAKVVRSGLNRYHYVFKALPDTTTEYLSPRGEYSDYMADSNTVKIFYDKTNPKINKPIEFYNANYKPIKDIAILSIITLIPIILVGIYFLFFRKRKAFVLKGLIILFAIMYIGVFIAIQIAPLMKGVDSIGFFGWLGGAVAIILIIISFLGSKKTKN